MKRDLVFKKNEQKSACRITSDEFKVRCLKRIKIHDYNIFIMQDVIIYIDNKTTLQSLLWLELIFYMFLFMSPTVFKFLFLIPKLILKTNFATVLDNITLLFLTLTYEIFLFYLTIQNNILYELLRGSSRK